MGFHLQFLPLLPGPSEMQLEGNPTTQKRVDETI
jgi:hypothetical protein